MATAPSDTNKKEEIVDEDAKTMAERNKHISTEQIEKDIADTVAEITQMEREVEGYRLIGDKLSMFKADARVSGIGQRKAFINKLHAILAYRRLDDDNHKEELKPITVRPNTEPLERYLKDVGDSAVDEAAIAIDSKLQNNDLGIKEENPMTPKAALDNINVLFGSLEEKLIAGEWPQKSVTDLIEQIKENIRAGLEPLPADQS